MVVHLVPDSVEWKCLAPGTRLVSLRLGPLLPPLLLVVVSRLCAPLCAAAVELTGVLALLNDTQP